MIPPYQQRGTPVSPSAFNQLIDLVRSSLLNGITGGTFSRSISGTTINIIESTGGVSNGTTGGAAVCFFEVTDASDEEGLKVEVGQNLIAGRWPSGMGLDFPPFKLEIATNSYIYAKVVYNTSTLQIDEDPDAITILQSETIQANTEDSVYVLIATVTVKQDPEGIKKIVNVCTQPVPNPCNLAWSQ